MNFIGAELTESTSLLEVNAGENRHLTNASPERDGQIHQPEAFQALSPAAPQVSTAIA